jgi:NAD(P)-dependent dehydrogenase (short-subunit alcohol dehydrogenase family)
MRIAIIGSSGALGSEFTKQIANNSNVKSVFAFSRSEIQFSSKKITSHPINIEDEDSIKNAAYIASKDDKLDMVIVATGTLHSQDIMPEKSLKDISAAKMHKIFSINTVGPAIISKHFLPQLNKSNKSIFAAISARVGSISDNKLGGWYSYRASKAALNMVLKNASIEIGRSNKNAIIVGLHPGTVASKLSEPFQSSVKEGKLFTPQYSVQKLLEVIENIDAKDSGNIFDFNGIKIDW